MARPLRALFLNEGALGTGPMGHARVEAAIRCGLQDVTDVEARFCSLAPMGLLSKIAVQDLPGLRRPDLDLQVVRWHLVQAARARRLVREELRRAPVDVVHVVSHSIAMGMRAEMRRVPMLLSVDVPVWEFREMALWRELRPRSRRMIAPSLRLERDALSEASLVLPWSDWARAGVARAAPRARCVTHHPGLDLRAFRPAARATRERRERPRILFVGGRFEAKGGGDLLAALDRLGPGVAEVDIVTQEPVAARPGVRVHRLGAGDARLVELFGQADVFCLPSHGDASPWVVAEAMACGAAVVATRVGAIPELLDEGRAGVLVAPRDPAGLARALGELLADPRRCEELGRAARQRCERHYDARRQTAGLVDLMRGAVARPASR